MLNKVVDTTIIEANLGRLYALWLREFKVFLRERSRLIASTFTPVLWLFVIGSGFGSTHPSTGVDYQKFIFPGIVSMSIIFSSVFFGSYIIWDRKFDFLKSVMEGKPVAATAVDGLRASLVGILAHQAVASGQSVAIDPNLLKGV